MSTDWREKEREFLADLEADTGRDLAQWMALVSAQRLAHRNDIIDWLRRQGFLFSRASWLERIHHNGGQPIYITAAELAEAVGARKTGANKVAAAAGATTVATAAAPAAETAAAVIGASPATARPERGEAETRRGGGETAPAVETAQPCPSDEGGEVPPATAAEIAEVLAKAKAYRPLAAHVLRTLQAAVPELVVAAGPGHLVLARPRPFGLLAVSGKDLRLALALGERPFEPPLEPVRLPVTLARAAQGLTHMIVLTDARQVDGRLAALAKTAANA